MLTRAGVVITVFLFSICSVAQGSGSHTFAGAGNQFNLNVNVVTANGEPAADARVELRDTNTGLASFTGYSNRAGYVALPNITTGIYEMVVTHKMAEVQQRVNLNFGEHNMTVRLPMTDTSAAEVGNSTSVSVAAFQVPDKARKEYKKAEEALNKNDRDGAYSHLNKALDIYGHYADALTLRAIVRMDKKDTDGALADLDAAIKSDSSCSLAYFAMGATFNSLEKYDDAIRTLQHGLTLASNSWQGYFELGKALVGKGEYKEGIEQLNKAQSFATTKYPSIHLVKAHAMLAIKEYPGAMKELQDFLTEAPGDSRSANAKETLDKVSAFLGKDYVAQK